jgi:methylthioribulose-1-phosphate dehydratase
MFTSLDEAGHAIAALGRRLDARGLAPATSGNYSVRLPQGCIAITVSGRPKGLLGHEDVMLVDAEGVALDERKPSAETGLHTLLYRLYPHVEAVVHVHSVAAVALTRYLRSANEIVLEGYEMLKAFPGISTHDTRVSLPVYENSQDIDALAETIAHQLPAGGQVPAYLIRAHGAYAWGRSLDEAERIIEALEYLLLCEIEALRLGGGGQHESLDRLSR